MNFIKGVRRTKINNNKNRKQSVSVKAMAGGIPGMKKDIRSKL